MPVKWDYTYILIHDILLIISNNVHCHRLHYMKQLHHGLPESRFSVIDLLSDQYVNQDDLLTGLKGA